MEQIQELYSRRPFMSRNADEYDISQILDLFVSPFSGFTTPFDYENSIIKGRMGSGKTMYLKANYAYYLYSIVESLANQEEVVLPVMIKLNDFQHLRDPSEIYKAIVIKIIEELASTYIRLQDAKQMAKIHMGIKSLPPDLLQGQKIANCLNKLAKLGSVEYAERITTELGLKGGIKPKFIEISAEFKEHKLNEIKCKPSPGIKDIEESYQSLLSDQGGKIILLIDEAGSLDKNFFRGKDNDSLFLILMNQLRTAPFIRTKIAIYPNSYQDILTETRYGDVILLENNIMDSDGYKEFRKKTCHIIQNYINSEETDTPIKAEDLFEINVKENYGDCIEQLINASNGNMRRLIQLLEASMEEAYEDHKGANKINLKHVAETLKHHARDTEGLYTEPERELLQNLVKACKSRSTYKFEFPNMSLSLNKYTSRSQEYNLINVVHVGTGRKSNIYAFDYSFCIAHDIPTHYEPSSEKINRDRSLANGRWAPRVARITDKVIEQASITAKVEGVIDFVSKSSGFIQGDDEQKYFFTEDYIIDDDKNKSLFQGRRVRFMPFMFGDSKISQAIEVL
ncbi:dsRNA-specific ribonuclease [Candidatus Scalindua japonica]|uniref:DsRNA-specific ribonuclease n=1 Tax=Candidatus Scalindua japonica TaxID=1284222 RepID=A0A286TYN7_9BACT|nr:hypothetical protein [Candidatus Scalindua japonica]GAX60931.1 dsRNA-specific ribonuclease [Candidatus Scalindua japonica]